MFPVSRSCTGIVGHSMGSSTILTLITLPVQRKMPCSCRQMIRSAPTLMTSLATNTSSLVEIKTQSLAQRYLSGNQTDMSQLRYAMCFVDSDEPYFDSADHLDKTRY